jgi:hypothetical protein
VELQNEVCWLSKWVVNFLLIGNKQLYVRGKNIPCACAWRKNLELLSQNDARTNASAAVRMTGFRSLTAGPCNPPVPLATNIASKILTGKAFQRAAEALQYAVPAPVASSMYSNVTRIFAAQHPHSTRFALTHTRWYGTDGSMIQSSLKELEPTRSKSIGLDTTPLLGQVSTSLACW